MLDKPDVQETASDCPWSTRSVTVEKVATAKLPTKRGDFRIAGYRSLISDAQRLQERIVRYQSGVVVPATQRIAVATAAYASNQSTLLTLFEARHAEVDAQRKMLSLRRDLAKAKMQLSLKPLASGARP